MKKIILFMMLIFGAFFAFAQGDPPNPDGVIGYISTFAGAVLLVNLTTGWIKNLLKWQGNAAKYLSWAIAVIISILGWLLNLGIFAPLEWWSALVYGLGIGLAANGAFKTEVIQQILIFLMAQLKPKV
jgi:hypothetical protein